MMSRQSDEHGIITPTEIYARSPKKTIRILTFQTLSFNEKRCLSGQLEEVNLKQSKSLQGSSCNQLLFSVAARHF